MAQHKTPFEKAYFALPFIEKKAIAILCKLYSTVLVAIQESGFVSRETDIGDMPEIVVASFLQNNRRFTKWYINVHY